MANDNFNKPLRLINKKPIGNQMINNGYAFYMFPDLVVMYANKVLKDTERRLYFAISGQSEKDKAGKPCFWAIKHYCEIANIKSNHYSEYLQGLHNKGFIVHNNFESIEVLYPISENEIISSNGQIVKRQDSKIGNNAQEEFEIAKVQDSPNGKSASSNLQESILVQNEEKTQKGNQEGNLGNNDSSNCANNREIEINKETLSTEEKDFLEELEYAVKGISDIYNNREKLIKQIRDLRKQGFSYEFIFRGIENKDFEYFDKGLNLLFYKPYQEEVYKIVEDFRKAEKNIEWKEFL